MTDDEKNARTNEAILEAIPAEGEALTGEAVDTLISKLRVIHGVEERPVLDALGEWLNPPCRCKAVGGPDRGCVDCPERGWK